MGEIAPPENRTGAPFSAPVPISAEHDVAGFRCGHASLDSWLHDRALQSEGKSSRTYVVCRSAEVLGYYALATGSVARTDMPRKLRQGPDPMPVMVLGRLAVAVAMQGRGLGADLLSDALFKASLAGSIVGMRAVLVHAIDDKAAAFYAKHVFVAFPTNAPTLFIPVQTIGRALL